MGLSLAFELARRSHQVTLIDRSQFGRKASWAGAGVLLPADFGTATHPIEQLEAISNDVHALWAKELLELTNIDNGYRESGGLYVARSPGEVASLIGSVGYWQERNIPIDFLEAEEVRAKYPEISTGLVGDKFFRAAYTTNESQICNPWHIESLVAACKSLNVQLLPDTELLRVAENSGGVGLQIESGQLEVDVAVWACGAWTQQAVVGAMTQEAPRMVPVRGQMLLYRLEEKLDLPIINKGNRYIVPRDDGHVLVGATIEEVGFDESTTEQALDQLASDAREIVPALAPDRLVKSWSGLRPGTFDSFPYMGKLPGCEKVYVSSGHFKTGLQLSTGAARVMSDLIESKTPEVDMTPFDPSRVLV